MRKVVYLAMMLAWPTGAAAITATTCDPTNATCASPLKDFAPLISVAPTPRCDEGWTLVRVATMGLPIDANGDVSAPGTRPMCAPVGDLKEPK